MSTKIISEAEPQEIEAEIAADLRAAIAHSGISQKDIAKRMGCSASYISALLTGKKRLSIQTIVAISLAAGWMPSFQFIPKDDEG